MITMNTFRMYVKIQFNRDIDASKDFVTFGDIDFTANDKEYRFEFFECESHIDRNEPNMLHVFMKAPDYSSECLEALEFDDLESVSEVKDIEIYTLETEKPLLVTGIEEISFEAVITKDDHTCEKRYADIAAEVVQKYSSQLDTEPASERRTTIIDFDQGGAE